MKTGFRRRIPHRTAVVAALSALTLVLALTACDDHSPTTAPTSTLPAQRPSTSTDEAEPQVPEYETELDLSTEEKEAVEGALVALDKFVYFTNQLYESGGEDVDDVAEVTTGESLEEVRASADSMVQESKIMIGEVTVEHRTVTAVDLDSGVSTVSISACSPSDTYHFVSPDSPSPAPEDSSNPEFSFELVLEKDSWKVSKQEWTNEECGP